MIVAGSASPLLLSSAAGGYNLTKSLRFRSSATAYLNRTFGSPTNNNKWTWSGWVKRGALGTDSGLFGAWRTTIGVVQCYFMSNNTLRLYVNDDTNTTYLDYQTSAVYRDSSAWYHVVISIDNTLSTTSALIYINGTQVTAFGTSTNTLVQNAGLAWNFNGSAGYIGQNRNTSNAAFGYFDGYLAEVNFIDGQQLTPSSFGETSTSTGVWIPKEYTGTYGTNGFYLPFTDTTSTSTLGTDFSGNSNTWTVNNISLTAGTTYDSMTDVPTLTDDTTANFATFNAVFSNSNYSLPATIANGNLYIYETTATNRLAPSTMALPSTGKFYFETTWSQISGGNGIFGLSTNNTITVNGYYRSNGDIVNTSGSAVTLGATWSSNDVIAVAVDVDAGTVQFYKNNSAQGATPSYSFTANTVLYPYVFFDNGSGNKECWINFGQRAFTYTPPTGFIALNTFNLPTPTIGATASSQANDYMNIVLYTGTGSSLSVTGVGFQPDWTWIKGRSGATDHGVYDAVRGVQKQLESNTTDAETTETTGLTAFGSDGFTVGALAQLNTSSATYIGWNWKANGAGSSNTQGSITSTVSASTTAGFSIVTYTGTGANATVGHGLGAVPSMYIVKKRSAGGDNWAIYHISTGNTNFLRLDTTNAAQTFNLWQDTTPTSSVFYLSSDVGINGSGATFVAYCFAPIAGYSAFGSYTGNGSTDGPFIFTGFRPRYVLIKRTDSSNNWVIQDTSRDTYNVSEKDLYADTAGAEATYAAEKTDILSNGFKQRQTGASMNASGGTYIYMAFCESPFKFSNAR